MRQKSYPLIFLTDNQEALDAMFNNQDIKDMFVPLSFDGALDTKSHRYNFIKNLLTVHMTDEKYYNKFEYEMRAKFKID